jgi:hypothetical protein
MPETEDASQPTPYPDINVILQGFLGRIRAILGESFTGMYLYGSLAQGDFNRDTSDIDFIVITECDLTEDEFVALGAIHADFRASSSFWAEKIEAAYVQKDALNLPTSPSSSYPQLEKGQAFAREPLEIGWPFQRYVLRNQGIVIAGPDPVMLMAPVPARELSEAALAIARMWQRDAQSDPSWLDWVRQRAEQRFVIVTLCRSLYTLACGTLAPKSAAAQWAQETLARRWASLVADALVAQEGTSVLTETGLAETLAFIDYTAERLSQAVDG